MIRTRCMEIKCGMRSVECGMSMTARRGERPSSGHSAFRLLHSALVRALSSDWLEQRTHNPEVTGSSPVPPTAPPKVLQPRDTPSGDLPHHLAGRPVQALLNVSYPGD